MKKIVNISGKEYSMKSSAYTQFKYKNDTGRKLLKDVQSLMGLQNLKQEEYLEKIEDLMDIILRMAYVMIEEADPNQVTSFEDFLKNCDGMLDDQQWLYDVIELATSPLSRGIQGDSH